MAVPITRGSKVVGRRQRFSDGLLRYLLERGERREAAAAKAAVEARVIEARPTPPGTPSPAEVDAALMKRLEEAAKRLRGEAPPPTAEERAKAAEWVAGMAAHGYTPPDGRDEGCRPMSAFAR